MSLSLPNAVPRFLPRASFPSLLSLLQRRGFQCIGPKEQDHTIVYAPVSGIEDFPSGVEVYQRPGTYTLSHSDTPRWFAWSNGPQALKPLLFSPREPLWTAARTTDGAVTFVETAPAPRPLAVIGVRPCDLAALALHNEHFLEGECVDRQYGNRYRDLLLVAVNCTHPADTCFCASTGDGPSALHGFDLLCDELDAGFVIRAGNERGESILEELKIGPADKEQLDAADEQTEFATTAQQRHILSRNLQHSLFCNLDHPQWEQIADLCLACGNCTAVCPTCFCYRETDEPQLDGTSSVHLREWDSCFSPGHSYIFGKTIRLETRLRYRQWLTHKLGSWHEQYGRSGCVGCGRCITWCPVGIDITEQVAIICGNNAEHA